MLFLLTPLSLSEPYIPGHPCEENDFLHYTDENPIITKTLEKGRTYCMQRSFLMTSDKPVFVKTWPRESENPQMYVSPFYVRSNDITELKCNYCTITIAAYNYAGDSGYPNYVVINHENLVLEFDWKKGEGAKTSLALFNPKPSDVTYTSSDHQITMVYNTNQYFYKVGGYTLASGTHVTLTIKPKSIHFRKLNEFIDFNLSKFIGKLPDTGNAYKAEDLKNEYKNPGTVTQENSTQGPPLKSEPDLSNGPKPNDKEESKFRATTGYKCDDFIVPGPLEILYLEKGKSYCSNKPYYLVADKPFQVREKHYVGGQSSKISASKIYQSPFYVGSEFSEITCDNCYIHYGAASSSDVNFFAMKQKDLTFTFALPANQKSFSVTSFNPTPLSVNYSLNNNDFKEIPKNDNNIYSQDLEENKLGQQVEIQIKENINAFQRRLQDVSALNFPEFVGRVPMRGNVFSIEDLKSEFSAPGTVNQQISKLGNGETDSTATGESSDSDKLKELNNLYKVQCDDIVVFDEITKFITIPQNKSYCITSPAVIGSKQKIEATLVELDFDKATKSYKPGKSSTFLNPEYIGASFSMLKCTDSSDCKVQFYFPHILTGEKSSSFIVISKQDAELPITLKNDGSHSAVINYVSQRITNMKITHNGNPVYSKLSETYGTHFLQLINENEPSNYKVTFTTKVTTAEDNNDNDDEWILPKIVGRVPTSGTAFVAKDLEKEYESPGTVKQENSAVEVKHSPTPQPKKGLGAGPIAAIVIVVILVVAAACVAVYFFVFRKKSDKSSEDINKA